MIVYNILLPIYQLHFQKFYPIQKQQELLKTYMYLVKATLVVYLIFYKFVVFETSIKFLELTSKLNTRMFFFQK